VRGISGNLSYSSGALALLDGIGPAKSALGELMQRINTGSVKELIIATNPNVHGEATALLITRMLKKRYQVDAHRHRCADGRRDLKYLDKMSISKSLEFRRGV